MTLNRILEAYSKAEDKNNNYVGMTKIHKSLGPYRRCTTYIKRIDSLGEETVVDYTSSSERITVEEEPKFIEENELKALKDFFTLVINNKL